MNTNRHSRGRQRGQTFSEYGVVAALIAVVVIGVILLFGTAIAKDFEAINSQIIAVVGGGNAQTETPTQTPDGNDNGGNGGDNPAPILASIVISPDMASVVAGTTQTYTATGEILVQRIPGETGSTQTYMVTGFDANGNSLGDVTDSTTFTISGSGTCSANACGTTVAGSYSVSATYAGLTNTATLNITAGDAYQIAFSQKPEIPVNSLGDVAGVPFSPQPVVVVQDMYGNTVTSDTSSVTLVSTNYGIHGYSDGNGSDGALSCTTNPLTAISGVASFSGCYMSTPGTYALTATDGSLLDSTGDPAMTSVTILPGDPAQLVFSQQPTNIAAGASISPTITVAIQDAYGNIAPTAFSNMTLAVTGGTATLNCGTGFMTAGEEGVLKFDGCTITTPGTYTLTATLTGPGSLISATSGSFTVAAASKLVFSQQPTNIAAGASISPAITVTVKDAGGNTVTTSSASITIAIMNNPAGGTLSGTRTVNAVNGVATFSNLSINRAGTGYTLTSSGSGLAAATSSSFNILVGAIDHFALSAETTTPTAGQSDRLTITALDANGNTATSYTGPHSLTFSGASVNGTTNPTVTNSYGQVKSFGTSTSINFANGIATVSGSSNGAMKLYKLETAHIVVSDGSHTNGSGLAVTVN